MTSRPFSTLRAAAWGWRAAGAARGQVRTSGMGGVTLPPVPPLPATAGRGVSLALRVRRSDCVVQALVRQAWFGAHGSSRAVIVGVTAPGEDFAAHAWLEGDESCHDLGFQELLRHPAGPASGRGTRVSPSR